MARIVLRKPMELMRKSEQDEVWLLSRTNEVFIQDVNGELWQVLDLTIDDDETVNLAIHLGELKDLIRDKTSKKEMDNDGKEKGK